MLSWIVDNAGLLYVLLGIVALGFGSAYWLHRKMAYAWGFFAAVAGILLVWLLGRTIVSDRQRIELNIREMADAVVHNRPQALLAHFASDFAFQGLSRKDVAERISRTSKQFSVSDIHVSQFQFEELSRDKKAATVFFRATVHATETRLFACRGFLVLEGDRWRLKEIRIYNPIVNQDQPIHIPLR